MDFFLSNEAKNIVPTPDLIMYHHNADSSVGKNQNKGP